jgi:Tol biopolymer transport system component/DNA-binding winged helix-turn-helix (wHTH) protein
MPDDSLHRPTVQPFRRQPPARIGAFEVRAASNELAGPAGLLRLRPRLMDVLLRLAASPGEVVTRQVLLDEVWPRRLVADEVLSRAIAELRTLLADDAREARYIETLPKVGYRLIAPVAMPAAPTPRAGGERVAPPASVAVPPAPVAKPRIEPWIAVAGLALAVGVCWVAWRLLAPSTLDALPPLERQLGNALPFSSDLEMEMAPRFSADGSKVAFALGDMESAHIVVQDVATRARDSLSGIDSFQIAPVFFPDGQKLAYYRRRDEAYAIVERSLLTGVERVLVDGARHPAPYFDLSPDGRRLVYASNEHDAPGLRLLDLDNGAVAMLTSPKGSDGLDLFPRFSPDGTEVAFVRGPELMRDVWVVRTDGSQAAHATGSPRGLTWGLAWLGSNGPLLVSADWFGGRALNVLDPHTGRFALAGARGGQHPDVSRNGDVVYEAAAYQANLHLVDTADPAVPERVLWPSAKYSNYPQFSPDGREVVFDSNRDNPISVFIGVIGGAVRRLPLPADHEFGEAHWSHDGRMIYAVRVRREGGTVSGAQAVRIDPHNANVEVIDPLGSMVAAVRDTADGSMLYYAVTDGMLATLWRAPAADPTQRERLPLPAVVEFDLEGDRLAYREPRGTSITVCELPALRCAPAALPSGTARISGWSLARDALWVRTGAVDQPGELMRLDLAQGKVTSRTKVGPAAIGANVAVSPDQRRAIVSVQERVSIDLMLAPHAR